MCIHQKREILKENVSMQDNNTDNMG